MSVHVFSQIYLHVNWHTDSNQRVLRDKVEEFVHTSLRNRCRETPGVFFEAVGGTDDHVHLAIRVEPHVSISELVGQLKGASAFETNKHFNAKILEWQRGFGIVSFGQKQLPWVVDYVHRQREHHAAGRIYLRLEQTSKSPAEAGFRDRVQEANHPLKGVASNSMSVEAGETDIPALGDIGDLRLGSPEQMPPPSALHDAEAPYGTPPDPAFALQRQAKDILSLADKDRRAAEIAFEQLGFDTQLETALALQGDELHEWLQLAEDFTELVRALPPEHLHQAVRLIGEEDALNLLQAASSEQMQQMTDIEWFTEGRLDRKKVRRWLDLLLTLDEDEADQALQGLDVNALAQYVRPSVRFAVDKDNLLLALHLNQRYLFTPDDLDPKDDFTRRLLDYLYAVDRDLFGDVMALLIGEDEQVVENDMYGGREDRLIKRGFPAQSEAEFLLEILNVSSYGIQWPKLEAPVPDAAAPASAALQNTARARTPFLLTALAWGRATKVLGERTEREFIKESAALANSLLLAHTKDSGKPELRSESLLAVQVLTSIALEALSGPLFGKSENQLSAAADKLKALELRELFQIGWSLTREVARDAWALAFDERIDRLALPRNLKWLPRGLRSDVMDAEDLMSWRRIAATAVETVSEADKDKRHQELLTWPRLCRLRHAVWLAQNDLARRESDAREAIS